MFVFRCSHNCLVIITMQVGRTNEINDERAPTCNFTSVNTKIIYKRWALISSMHMTLPNNRIKQKQTIEPSNHNEQRNKTKNTFSDFRNYIAFSVDLDSLNANIKHAMNKLVINGSFDWSKIKYLQQWKLETDRAWGEKKIIPRTKENP